MKLVIILLFLIKLCYSNNIEYIYITPYSNSCIGDCVGVGYQLPLNECVTIGVNIINNAYLKLSGNTLTVSWLNNCSLPLDFSDATQYTYSIDTCSNFKVPYDNYFISTISTSGSIPNDAIVFNYYFQQSSLCSGSVYKLYITNGSSYQDVTYTCKKNKVSAYTCSEFQCYTYSINNSCQDNQLYPYPFIVTC